MSQQGAETPPRGWTAADLEKLPGGVWHNRPEAGWQACDIAIFHDKTPPTRPCLFIAMDTDTWLQGSGNTGIYAGWNDTHLSLSRHASRYCGAIVQRRLDGLPPDFPQLVVGNSYEALQWLGEEARRRLDGKLVAITGTVGKTSTKEMLESILATRMSVVASHGNHNTRTGASVTLARTVCNPQAVVMEVAISALWMRNGGLGPRIKPHIVIITEIGMTQVGKNVTSLDDVARFKARISHGLIPGGYAILNRDMAGYETLAASVTRDGARIISYGFHPDADARITAFTPDGNGSLVTLNFRQQSLSYRLAVPGKGAALNSVASLIAADLLGVSLPEIVTNLEAWHSDGQHMGITCLTLPEGGAVTLIDDSYNAEYLSMLNAFEVAGQRARDSGGRVVALLGRIVNLGDQSDAIHRSLAEPLLAAGCGKAFLHGEEMAALHGALPETIRGGHFRTAQTLVDAAAPTLRDGDIVLVKGSVRNSDFNRVISLLKTRLAAPPALKKEQTARLLVNLATGETRVSELSDSIFAPTYLSQLLLTTCVAERLLIKEMTLETPVEMHGIAAHVLKGNPALGLPRGSTVTLKSLLQGMLIHNACDAAIHIAEQLAGSSAGALTQLRELMGERAMAHTHINNVSGRPRPGQRTTLRDVARLLYHFYLRYPHLLSWFAEHEAAIGEHVYRKTANLYSNGSAWGQFSAGRWGFALQWIAGDLWLACAAGADDAFHLDYLLDELLSRADGAQPAPVPVERQIDKPAATITLLGDTYFGEWYTRKRQRRGIDDALQRYGYDHSFAGIAPLLRGSDFTLANFEAALATDLSASPEGRKTFCLAGDPQASVAALRKQGIDAVALGNNHAMDAGLPGLHSTLAAFSDGGIATIGAGLNAQQAHAPLVLTVGDRQYKIFSAYWYRRFMEQECAFYARPRRAGVACLSGGLTEQLRLEKTSARPSTTIVLAHWGLDYRWTTAGQRALAQRLSEAGADLIIGSGPHMPGEAARLGESLVLYSIGNGVFNSNGEYRERGMPPYGFIVRLLLGEQVPQIQLLPILTDNKKTFWQPRPVNEAEFTDLIAHLTAQGMPIIREEASGAGWRAVCEEGEYKLIMTLDAYVEQ
ncbi:MULTISPECIES: CapA family protein [unclassified Leclercia]|uniref:CapA family protein n=1 Tax=Leclercia barmai TaxID=2785629 RepID=A0ABS7RPW0_9ENTR|nr:MULTISPECIES: CapA family protein [unclassified Leclercia]MBZ0056383.1 CapA family protein [Leclercia sp. EMC7]MCM5694347.1 CapA family protein [Leclercia sp. LTM01]MCM5699267.1 CapA family protein [Leclercia sp. LTM14]